MATARADIHLRLITSGLEEVKAASKAMQGLMSGRGAGAAGGARAAAGGVRDNIGIQIRSAQMMHRNKARNEAFTIRAQLASAKMAQREREQIARAEMQMNATLDREARRRRTGPRPLTLESETASVQRMIDRRRLRAQARANLGVDSKGDFLQGHGFASRARQAVGAARDLTVAGLGVRYAVMGMAGAWHSMIDPAREFGLEIAKMGQKGGYTAEQTQKLSASMITMGKNSLFSPTQAAAAAVELAAAGVAAEKMGAALPNALKFAQAADIGTESAATMLVDTSTQFELGVENFASIGDTIVKAANASTISISDMSESLKFIGPLAHKAGWDLEFTAGTIAALGEAGIKGSMGGTALRTILASLVHPARQAKTALAQLGITPKQLQAGTRDLPGFFEMLDERMAKRKLDNAQRLEMLKLMFGNEGFTAATALMSMQRDGESGMWAKMVTQVRDARGELERTAEAMGTTLDGKLRRVNATIETTKIQVATGLAPTIDKVLPKIASMATAIGDWSARNAELIPGLVEGIATLGGLALAGKGAAAVAGVVETLLGAEAVAAVAASTGASLGALFAGGIIAGITGYGLATKIIEATGFDNVLTQAGASLAGGAEGRKQRGLEAPEYQGTEAQEQKERDRQAAFDWAAGGAAGEIVVKVQDDRTKVSTRSKNGPKLRLGENVSHR